MPITRANSSRGMILFRWVTVLPAAVAGYVVSAFLFYVSGEGRPDATIMLASFCVTPAVFVFCGSRVAPSHRFGTAVVLTVLFAITVTAIFTWGATAQGYDNWLKTGKSLAWAVLGVISTLVTSLLIYRTEQENRLVEEILNNPKTSGPEGCDAQSQETSTKVDPFATLGVRSDASFEEIRQAYWNRMKEYHPDRVAGLGPELRVIAERKAREINAAFEVLKERHGVV